MCADAPITLLCIIELHTRGAVRADPHGVAEELSELMGAADEVDELGDADAVGGALHTLLSL